MKDQKDQARWIALLAATAIALYLCWLMLKPFIGVLQWAVVLVIVVYPVHKRLASRIKRPGLSALISCLLVVLVVILPLTIIAMAVAEELAKVIPNVPGYLSQLSTMQAPFIGRVSDWFETRFGIDTVRSEQFAAEQLQRTGEFLLGFSVSLAGNIAGGIIKAFFVIFTMYYLFRDGEKIVQKLPEALPLSKPQSETIIARTKQVVGASVYGVVSIAALQGVLGGIAFTVLGIPSPILWAVLMTFVCMIPVAGSFMVWVPLAIYLIAQGNWIKAVMLIAWGALVISTVDNFLRPRLIRSQTRLHELFVFFSVLGGITVFGLIGIILGPVVLAITIGLLQTYRQQGVEE